MGDLECFQCMETYNKSTRKPVVCLHCEYKTCRSCAKRFILGSVNEAKCMNCEKEWNREFLIESISYSFVSKEYKIHRENILFETEVAQLEETQAIIERRKEANHYTEEINRVYEEIRLLRNRIERCYSLRNECLHATTVKKSDRPKFYGFCPKDDCKGFISGSWKCGICETKVCKSCKIELTEETEEIHECKQSDLESLKVIKNSSKPCPKCSVPIHRISGCSQMWCPNCHITFDWRSGEIIVKGVFHNPHFLEWQRRQNNTVPEFVEDGCNGIDFRNFNPRTLSGFVKSNNSSIYHLVEVIRLINHIQDYEVRELNRKIMVSRNNLELRILYMTKKINEVEFKRKIQIQNKKVVKYSEIRDIETMFCTTVETYIRQYVIRRKRVESNDTRRIMIQNVSNEELQKFFEIIRTFICYTNESFEKVSKKYKNKTPRIRTVTRNINSRYGKDMSLAYKIY